MAGATATPMNKRITIKIKDFEIQDFLIFTPVLFERKTRVRFH
jgi:hypothetical protein